MKSTLVSVAFIEVGFRVEPPEIRTATAADYRSALTVVAEKIRESIGNVSCNVVVKEEEFCTLCREPWEVDPTDGLPLCCDAAREEWAVARV